MLVPALGPLHCPEYLAPEAGHCPPNLRPVSDLQGLAARPIRNGVLPTPHHAFFTSHPSSLMAQAQGRPSVLSDCWCSPEPRHLHWTGSAMPASPSQRHQPPVHVHPGLDAASWEPRMEQAAGTPLCLRWHLSNYRPRHSLSNMSTESSVPRWSLPALNPSRLCSCSVRRSEHAHSAPAARGFLQAWHVTASALVSGTESTDRRASAGLCQRHLVTFLFRYWNLNCTFLTKLAR